MGTIAYKDGILAADTQIVKNGLRVLGQKKIFELESCVMAYEGELSQLEIVKEFAEHWIKKGDSISLPGNYSALIFKDGKLYQADPNGLPYEAIEPCAIGSCAVIAMTAMKLGRSAIDAVLTAIEMDVYSGGSVQSHNCMKLKDHDIPLPEINFPDVPVEVYDDFTTPVMQTLTPKDAEDFMNRKPKITVKKKKEIEFNEHYTISKVCTMFGIPREGLFVIGKRKGLMLKGRDNNIIATKNALEDGYLVNGALGKSDCLITEAGVERFREIREGK
jgi:hypothetical protein